MPSERVQRRIDALLDQAEAAIDADQWSLVASKARAVLAIDANSDDATAFLQMAVANGISEAVSPSAAADTSPDPDAPANAFVEAAASAADPESFVGGRYKVLHFLGEGGKKRVFLAHDALLGRDVAFSLIKTDGLDDAGRARATGSSATDGTRRSRKP